MRTLSTLARGAIGMLFSVVLAVLVEPLYRSFRQAMEVTSRSAPVLPRLIRNVQHAWQKRGRSKLLAGGRGFALRHAVAAAALVLLIVGITLGASGSSVFALAITAPATLKSDLAKITKEAEELQKKYEGKRWETADREKFEALCKEGEEIQAEIKNAERFGKLNDFASEIEDPTMPETKGREEQKRQADRNRIAGFITLGEAVTNSPGLKAFIEAGMPKTHMTIYTAPEGKSIEGHAGRRVFIALNREEREAWEAKAVPTIGAGVIEPDRIADIVRATEQDELRLRDVMNVSQTSAASVTYIRISSVTRAAAAVAAGSAKPEATMATEVVTETVRTQAVWMPVHNNQLADLPQLRNMIDTELLYDLRKYEEEQIMYGAGTGEEFEGIVTNTDVLAARTASGDTLIDIIRRAVTDVRRAGYSPNAVAIDPLDWEEVELEKGTDNRYVWAVIRDTLGARIWSLRVVETVGAEANEGNSTERRNLVVGDWIRGATLWVRETPSVAVGWINDQFTKNQRTLLAEQRAAFGVKRPKAFRKHETQAAVS